MSMHAMNIAHQTVDFIKQGRYLGNTFSKDITKARVYAPNELKNLTVPMFENFPDAKIEIYNQDTCECAKRFINDGYTCVLNFASARHVGGGFLNGAMAQEEAICRNSTLYASINSKVASIYYSYNNSHYSELYSDYMIFSPHVEVIRSADGKLLSTPYTISVITSPAVNVNRAKHCTYSEVNQCMTQRAEYVLKVAVSNHVENLVLGAWGCGVFGNPPKTIAEIFRHLLLDVGYAKAFKNVAFAVYGRNPENYNAFYETFFN
jgi:uncharacterized protein (TIGR02452 family)